MNSWITFADNDIYLKSAYALALSLKKVNSIYPLCIMIPKEINNNHFNDFKKYTNSLNVTIKEVPYLFFNFLKNYKQNITINKFHMFSFIEYDKLCFIDADSYFIQNMDFIFNLKTPAAGYYYNDKNEKCISGGIFLIKPDLSFYSVLLNLCITLDFYDDDNLFYYLSQENNILKFNSFFNDEIPNYRDLILQEQKTEKFWSKYSYDKIYDLVYSNGEQLLYNYIFN